MFRSDRLSFVGLAIPIVVALLVAFQFATMRNGTTLLGPGLGADYPAFYAAGRLVLGGRGHQLYDLGLQTRLQDEARPGDPPHGSLFFVHPPFAALPFVPLAAFAYPASYFVWMAVSVAIFVVGLLAIRRACPSVPRSDWVTATRLSFAWSPVLLESIVGGQIAVFAFAVMASALTLARRERLFLAGLSLSLLAYKPTLLVLIGPLLILGRRWHALAGLLTGCLLLLVVSLMTSGVDGCRGWLELMATYARLARESPSAFRLFKFVDLSSFLAMLFGERSWLIWPRIGLAVPPVLWLAAAWARRARFDEALLWAATMSWTLVLNAHVAIYDLTATVPGVLMTLDALARRHDGRLELSAIDRNVLAWSWSMPWLTQAVAVFTNFSPITPVLGALAAWQLVAARADDGKHDAGARASEYRPEAAAAARFRPPGTSS